MFRLQLWPSSGRCYTKDILRRIQKPKHNYKILSFKMSLSSSSCSWRVRRVSCSLILKMKLVPPTLPRSSYVPSSFGLYCSACFDSLFVPILCTCCSHFFRYCFISFIMSCAPVFCLIHWFFSLSSFVIPSKCLKFSFVLLPKVVPFFSSLSKLHFQISMLL